MKLSDVARNKLRGPDIRAGQRFGQWTVTGFKARPGRPTMVVVRCSRGFEAEQLPPNLRHRYSTKCMSCAGTARARKYRCDGKSLTVSSLADMAGVKYATMAARLRSGRTAEEAMRFVRKPRWPGGWRKVWDGKTVGQLAALHGIGLSTLKMRLRAGDDFPHALRPVRKASPRPLRRGRGGRPPSRHVYMGERLTISELAAKSGLSAVTIRHRLRQGWTVEQAVATKRGMMPRRSATP